MEPAWQIVIVASQFVSWPGGFCARLRVVGAGPGTPLSIRSPSVIPLGWCLLAPDPDLETLHPSPFFAVSTPHLGFFPDRLCQRSQVMHVWTVSSSRNLSFRLRAFHGFSGTTLASSLV